MCFKTEQHSVQKGIKKFGEKVNTSVTKKIRDLAVKYDCFREVDRE